MLAQASLEWQQLQLSPPWPAAHRLMLRLASADGKRHCPLTLTASLARQPRQTGWQHQESSPLRSEGSLQRDFPPSLASHPADDVPGTAELDARVERPADMPSPRASPPSAAMSLLKRPVGLRQFALSVDLHSLTRLTSHPQSLRVGHLLACCVLTQPLLACSCRYCTSRKTCLKAMVSRSPTHPWRY